MVQREPVSTAHSPLHPRAFRFFVVPLLLARLPLRAPLFYQLLALSTTAVSIVIQRLALTTRLLRRLLLRFFLPLILQFGLIPFLRFLHFAAAGAVSGVLRVTGARRQSCASLGHAASLARHWGTPPVASRCASPRLLDSRNACPHHLRHLHAIAYPWRRIAGFAVPRTSAKVFP